MIEYSEKTRWLAWAAYKQAAKQINLACKLFRAMGPDEIPSHLGEFIKKWGGHVEQYGTVSNTPGRGSKTHVDPELVQAALERFVKGYITDRGAIRFYPTFELAMKFDPEIKALVERSGVTPATFFAHMLQVTTAAAAAAMPAQSTTSCAPATNKLGCLMQARPSLHKVSEIVKAELAADVKEERMLIGRELLQLGIEDLVSMVFVDCGTCEVRPESQRVWVDTLRMEERQRMYLDPFLTSSKTITMKFYVAVNAQLGPCCLMFVTGTTGLHLGFKVC
jgi:hypothetical protein